VTAAPRRKYSFSAWTENGVVVSTSSYFAFTLDRNRNLVAQFAVKRARRHR
jgi:hypothetical protein